MAIGGETLFPHWQPRATAGTRLSLLINGLATSNKD